MKHLPCTISYHFARQLHREMLQECYISQMLLRILWDRYKMRSSGIPERWGWREMAKEIPQMKVQEVPRLGGWVWGKYILKILPSFQSLHRDETLSS